MLESAPDIYLWNNGNNNMQNYNHGIDGMIDMLVQAGYQHLVHTWSPSHYSITSQARIGLLQYLEKQQIEDIFLEDEDMQRYVNACIQYIVALFLFASLKTEREQTVKRRSSYPLLQRAEETIVTVCQYLIGPSHAETMTLAQMSLQLVFFSSNLSQADLKKKALAVCTRHFALFAVKITDREEWLLEKAMKRLLLEESFPVLSPMR